MSVLGWMSLCGGLLLLRALSSADLRRLRASDSKWTKSVVLPSVQKTSVFFTNTSAALNLEFSSILRAENPVKQSMA
jgi:hypothetical protein